jgi:hypothetical protein
MNKQNLHKLLLNFCSKDAFRDSLHNPIAFKLPEGDYIMASDGIRLAAVPVTEYPDHEFAHYHNLIAQNKIGANMAKVCNPDMFQDKASWVLNIADIDAVLDQIKKEPEYKEMYKECKQCEGTGKEECACCGHENECDECDGEGEVVCGKEETGYHKYPENVNFQIDSSYFSLQRMGEFINEVKALGVDKLLVHQVFGNKPFMTTIEGTGILFLLMPLDYEYVNKERINVINLVANP